MAEHEGLKDGLADACIQAAAQLIAACDPSVIVIGATALLGACAQPTFDPEDPAMLQDLIVAALNDANRKVDEAMQEKVGGLAGIPGLSMNRPQGAFYGFVKVAGDAGADDAALCQRPDQCRRCTGGSRDAGSQSGGCRSGVTGAARCRPFTAGRPASGDRQRRPRRSPCGARVFSYIVPKRWGRPAAR